MIILPIILTMIGVNSEIKEVIKMSNEEKLTKVGINWLITIYCNPPENSL